MTLSLQLQLMFLQKKAKELKELSYKSNIWNCHMIRTNFKMKGNLLHVTHLKSAMYLQTSQMTIYSSTLNLQSLVGVLPVSRILQWSNLEYSMFSSLMQQVSYPKSCWLSFVNGRTQTSQIILCWNENIIFNEVTIQCHNA